MRVASIVAVLRWSTVLRHSSDTSSRLLGLVFRYLPRSSLRIRCEKRLTLLSTDKVLSIRLHQPVLVCALEMMDVYYSLEA